MRRNPVSNKTNKTKKQQQQNHPAKKVDLQKETCSSLWSRTCVLLLFWYVNFFFLSFSAHRPTRKSQRAYCLLFHKSSSRERCLIDQNHGDNKHEHLCSLWKKESLLVNVVVKDKRTGCHDAQCPFCWAFSSQWGHVQTRGKMHWNAVGGWVARQVPADLSDGYGWDHLPVEGRGWCLHLVSRRHSRAALWLVWLYKHATSKCCDKPCQL